MQLLSLVRKFVTRQELARQLLTSLRPDLAGVSGEAADKERVRATAIGRWGADQQWSYRIHGHGCTMEHVGTHEPISWVAPDVQRFDPEWFLAWLEWQARQPEGVTLEMLGASSVAAPDVRSAVFGWLQDLVHAGLLRFHPGRTNAYELLSKQGEDSA